MAVYKCKMCGASLEAPEGATTATCGYCRTEQTLPKANDDRRANLYDRAGHFRRANEYDKAMRLYEQVLADDPTDAEAYWSVVLCRYGIEYVEDPATRRRVPTVNRMQTSSILADPDYRQALEYADLAQKGIYEREARAISSIQEGISEVAAKEEPYDVFICYKETDDQGRRTRDSVLATELYNELTREGFRVFFSRVTLEDKLGTAYEPYIFAALNSAKAMVVLGTQPGHFNAAWVRNEWARYLALIRGGARKTLIPAYRDMDPYDLPEEFAHLQAQDMSKLGFMQDLVRGIRKIVQAGSGDASSSTPKKGDGENTDRRSGANAEALLERTKMALEDGEWEHAEAFCERILDSDARNATAYLYKLMSALKVRQPEDLGGLTSPFGDRPDYQKAIRFGDDEMRSMLEQALEEAGQTAQKSELYDEATTAAKAASSAEEFEAAAQMFDRLGGYRDSASKAKDVRNEWQRIEAVAEDIVSRYGANGDRTYKTELERLHERKKQLLEEKASAPILLKQASEARHALDILEQQLDQLRAERNKLGIFAFDKRRAADRRISLDERRLSEFRSSSQQTLDLARRVRDSSVIDADLTECERMIEVEKEAEQSRIAADVRAARHTKADLDDPRVLAQLRRAHPEETALLGILGIGDAWQFGHWGGEPISWRTIAREGKRILAITDRVIDFRQFNTANTPTHGNDWYSCDLKHWLEGEFERGAFDGDEKARLESHPFCLSIEEAEKYFEDDEDRACGPSTLVVKRNVWISDAGTISWWLRSPTGYSGNCVACVSDGGGIVSVGNNRYEFCNGVRPALWLTL